MSGLGEFSRSETFHVSGEGKDGRGDWDEREGREDRIISERFFAHRQFDCVWFTG